jgi:meiosis-specific protein HOP1
MMTHSLDEIPDKWSIGKVQTGHHSYMFNHVGITHPDGLFSVDVNVSSITAHLPSAEHQEGAFSGMTGSSLTSKTLTPLQEATVRAQQIEDQEKDALTRNLVWSTECDVAGLDADADGEDESLFEQQPDGSFLQMANIDIAPLGVRTENGIIETIALPGIAEEAVFGGVMESVPTDLNDLVMPDVHFVRNTLTYFAQNNQDAALATMGDETQSFTFEAPNPSSSINPSTTSTPKHAVSASSMSLPISS